MKNPIVFLLLLFPFLALAQDGGRDEIKIKTSYLQLDSTKEGTFGKVLTIDNDGEVNFVGKDSIAFDTLRVGDSKIYDDGANMVFKDNTIGSVKTLSELAAGGGLVYNFELNGPLSQGDVVQLLSNGRIEGIGFSEATQSIPSGSEYVYNSSATTSASISFAHDNSGKFVIAYADGGNSDYGTAIVGTISGNTISFGSEYVFNSASTSYISVAINPDYPNTFLVTYRDVGNSNYGTIIEGTISGTTISYGSEHVLYTNNYYYTQLYFDLGTPNKFVIFFMDWYGYEVLVAGIVSSGSFTFGSLAYMNGYSGVNYADIAFDPFTTDRFLVSFQDDGNSSRGTAMICTITGLTITFGAEYVFGFSMTNTTSVAFDPFTQNKFIISYTKPTNSSQGYVSQGTISGTSITFNAETGNFNAAATSSAEITYDPNNSGKFIVTYVDDANSYRGTVRVGTISATTISFGNEIILNSGTTSFLKLTDVSSLSLDNSLPGKFLTIYNDDSNSGYGTIIMGQLYASFSNLNGDNIIGVLQESGLSNEFKPVSLPGGIDNHQTGLTIGSFYYVQSDGSISTSSTGAFLLGKAISTTAILMKPLN